MRGGDVDDAAILALLHPAHRGADCVERGREIERDDGVILVDREILDRRDELNARIVHEDIEPPMRGFRSSNERSTSLSLHQVGAVITHRDAGLTFKAGADLFDLGGVAQTVERHIHASIGQCRGYPQPDAAG